MDQLFELYQSVTPAQAELISAFFGLLSVLLAAILAPLVFHIVTARGVRDFQKAIDEVTASARTVRERTEAMSISLNQLDERIVGMNELLSAVQMTTSIVRGESEAEEQVRPDEPAARAAPPIDWEEMRDLWTQLRNKLETIASHPGIDGRTRAKYSRIDRRDYVRLVHELKADGRLGSDGENWIRAALLWYQYRPNNQPVTPADLTEMENLARRLLAAGYAEPDTERQSLALRIRNDACKGAIPVPLTGDVILEHYPEYSEGHAKTVLANNCEGGYWPRQGRAPLFRRVGEIGEGTYEPICP